MFCGILVYDALIDLTLRKMPDLTESEIDDMRLPTICSGQIICS